MARRTEGLWPARVGYCLRRWDLRNGARRHSVVLDRDAGLPAGPHERVLGRPCTPSGAGERKGVGGRCVFELALGCVKRELQTTRRRNEEPSSGQEEHGWKPESGPWVIARSVGGGADEGEENKRGDVKRQDPGDYASGTKRNEGDICERDSLGLKGLGQMEARAASRQVDGLVRDEEAETKCGATPEGGWHGCG